MIGWARRIWRRVRRQSEPFDWARELPDLRHNGGHVHHIRVARYRDGETISG